MIELKKSREVTLFSVELLTTSTPLTKICNTEEPPTKTSLV